MINLLITTLVNLKYLIIVLLTIGKANIYGRLVKEMPMQFPFFLFLVTAIFLLLNLIKCYSKNSHKKHFNKTKMQ